MFSKIKYNWRVLTGRCVVCGKKKYPGCKKLECYHLKKFPTLCHLCAKRWRMASMYGGPLTGRFVSEGNMTEIHSIRKPR